MMEAMRATGKAAGAAALVMAMPVILVGLTALEAGKDRGAPYRDTLGRNMPWTVCDGVVVATPKRYTEKQCDDLVQGLVMGSYGPGVIGCVPALGLPERRNQLVASIWFAWNLGVPVFCASSAVKAMNVGRWRDGCQRLTLYNRSRGVVRKGLINRRAYEVKRCLQGL
jgi:lysozyme